MRCLKLLIITLICIAINSCNDLNKIAKVEYSFSGCFGSGTNKLEIFKSGNDTVATLKLEDGKMLKTKLNTSQIKNFQKFVNELKTLREGGYCTTEESYIVYYNYDFIKKTTARCDWQGFLNFKKSLFH